MTLTYHVTGIQMTIHYNKHGDHDHNGLLFVLSANVPVLKYLEARAKNTPPPPSELETLFIAAQPQASELGIVLPIWNPPDHPSFIRARNEARVHPLIRPLVLRARLYDEVKVVLRNEIQDRWIGIHLVADGYAVKTNDGSDVGQNPHSLVAPEGTRTYRWTCNHEGVFPFHDGGNYSGGEDGTNAHGLFGALAIEPVGAIWRDPVTGRRSVSTDGTFQELDGLYLDILPPGNAQNPDVITSSTTLPTHTWTAPVAYHNFNVVGHREFVIFFHDEPEFLPPHDPDMPKDPCLNEESGGGHGGHGDILPIMPISYRSEPMINRERILWGLIKSGHDFQGRPVLNEEQHHSSWMFGDPDTPILKAYIGDPVRIRFVHAGVKETHVFHLHLYEWHAVPEATNIAGQYNTSPRIDAISVSPQTGHTIEPVWGAGNRHQVAGDVIWHCHLYPHFHEGMWGMFRTFETLQDGAKHEALTHDASPEESMYAGRYIGQYPDGTPIEMLLPLPDRPIPPRPTSTHPGFPLYIPGIVQQKSPIPPWPDRDLEAGETFCDFTSLRASAMPPDFNYRSVPTRLERNAFNGIPLPGELFTRNPLRPQQNTQWTQDSTFEWNSDREVCHNVAMERQRIDYNDYGWYDKDGHLYFLEAEGSPEGRPRPKEPLFFRALHGQILNLTFHNRSPLHIDKTEFDPEFPPCAKREWQAECSTHVHMVKFDPICADGASTGWNYISGPVATKKMIYRWWLDQEFGTIFFHDHLFANFRQKHGLFGALLVEPKGSQFFHHINSGQKIVSGLQAVIVRHEDDPNGPPKFREFCIGIADFIPMWDRHNTPLNPPDHPGGHGDQGVMALNYRSDPIHERLEDSSGSIVDPSRWFTSLSPYNRDPYTTRFVAYEGDPIWLRIIQGSHEEQHSFQIHGMRWQRFRGNMDSAIRNQQTFGLAEAYTFIINEPYGPGDYMYKLSGADDLWLGCWGIIRAFPWGATVSETGEPLPVRLSDVPNTAPQTRPPVSQMRRFRVAVRAKRLVYREPDLVDPFGLVYQLVSITPPMGVEQIVDEPATIEPLVLRCREGEWVQVTLVNELPLRYTPRPEPFAPQVPVEEQNPFSHRPERPVSTHVSMHADLVLYNIQDSDGANVGRNPFQSAGKGGGITYTWNTYRPPNTNANEPLGPILLQDMADFRNHRHHGLIGALIVESTYATPYKVDPNGSTAIGTTEAWYGTRATVIIREPAMAEYRFEEAVLLLQDGLRLYLRGNIHSPIADEPPGNGDDELDKEDQGQKGFNYRSEPVGPNVDPLYDPNNASGISPGEWYTGDWLSTPNPATPVFKVPFQSNVQLHLIGACDKPRNHSFTVHGVAWPEWRYLPMAQRRPVSSESGITCGTVRKYAFRPQYAGDHAYRNGILKWMVPQGLWGILRVEPKKGGNGCLSALFSVSLLALLLAWLGKKENKEKMI
ncbi:MAG: multicopper oxidase domain-containing protein [Flavisolibacter sp.]|nr:multicopper oxidase domain-containing protein [Flavisolibacter sp.]